MVQLGSRQELRRHQFIAFIVGETRVYCMFRFVDKARNEVLLERMENGSIWFSVAASASAGAMKELASTGDVELLQSPK